MILLATILSLQMQAKLQLTLAQAVDWARDSSASARLAASRESEARSRESEATSHLLPTLTASASQMTRSYNFLTSGVNFPGFAARVPFYNIQDARLSVQAPLLSPVAWKGRLAAEQGVRARGAEREAAREDASLRGGLAWVELAKAQMLERDREEALQLAMDLETMADDQKSSGSATGLDVLRAQSQVVVSRRALSQARQARERTAIALLRDLGLAGGGDTLVAAGVLSLQPTRSGPERLQGAPARVRAASQVQDAVRLEAEATKAKLLPTLGVEADYGYSAGVGQFSGGGSWTGQVGIFAEWQIWGGGGDEARLAQARERQRQATIASGEAVRQSALDLDEARSVVERSLEQLELGKTQAALADSQLVLSRERFQDGASGNLEVVQAQAERNTAHAAWIEAAGAYQAALVRRRWATGHCDGF